MAFKELYTNTAYATRDNRIHRPLPLSVRASKHDTFNNAIGIAPDVTSETLAHTSEEQA